jgi:hypothetical protein
VRIDDTADSQGALHQAIIPAGGTYQVPLTARQPTIQTGRPQVLRVQVAGRDLGTLGTEERRISGVSLLANDLARQLQPGTAGAAPQQPSLQGPPATTPPR